MSRSGYSEGCEHLELYRGNVGRAIKGKRGQAFLREMIASLDAMPVRELETELFVDLDGACCGLGAVALSRGMTEPSRFNREGPETVGDALGITGMLAAEIAYQNDEGSWLPDENSGDRWVRMRAWAQENLTAQP